MTTRKLDEQEWHRYFDEGDRALRGLKATVEVVAGWAMNAPDVRRVLQHLLKGAAADVSGGRLDHRTPRA